MTILDRTLLACAIALLGASVGHAQAQPEPLITAPNAEPPRGATASSKHAASPHAAPSAAELLSGQQSVALSTMSESAARAIQAKLQELGFYQGELDGIVGPQTKRALRAFYSAQAELIAQGKLLADAAATTFKLSAADVEPVRGAEHPMERREGREPMRGISPAHGVSPTQGMSPVEAAPPQPQPPSSVPAPIQEPGSVPPPTLPSPPAAPRRQPDYPPSTSLPQPPETSIPNTTAPGTSVPTP
jgi:peptidoglycan hydrolase-like protein with peptidoglycan-binding domain